MLLLLSCRWAALLSGGFRTFTKVGWATPGIICSIVQYFCAQKAAVLVMFIFSFPVKVVCCVVSFKSHNAAPVKYPLVEGDMIPVPGTSHDSDFDTRFCETPSRQTGK